VKKTLTYILWADSTLIGEWTDPKEARDATRAYIEDNPEDYMILHLALGQKTREHGLQILQSHRGQELLEYLEDELD
jgi:hypothetical protein